MSATCPICEQAVTVEGPGLDQLAIIHGSCWQMLRAAISPTLLMVLLIAGIRRNLRALS